MSTTTVTAPPTVTAPVTVTAAPKAVRIDRAELVLEPLVGTDGATWLIPAYRFGSSTSPGAWTVLAIDRTWFDPDGQSGSDTTETVRAGAGTSGSSGTSPGSSVASSPSTMASTPAPSDGSSPGTAVPVASKPSGSTG